MDKTLVHAGEQWCNGSLIFFGYGKEAVFLSYPSVMQLIFVQMIFDFHRHCFNDLFLMGIRVLLLVGCFCSFMLVAVYDNGQLWWILSNKFRD